MAQRSPQPFCYTLHQSDGNSYVHLISNDAVVKSFGSAARSPAIVQCVCSLANHRGAMMVAFSNVWPSWGCVFIKRI